MAALRHTSRSLCIFLTLSLLACGSRGELFTAIVHMEGLLHLERELLSGLNEYIVAERARLVWKYFSTEATLPMNKHTCLFASLAGFLR